MTSPWVHGRAECPCRLRFRANPPGLPRRRTRRFPARQIRNAARPCWSSRFGGELLALLDRLLDGADHVEGGLRQVIVFALDQALEALDGILQVDELAGRAGEHFGDMERLRQEALDLAGDRKSVV